VLIRFESKLLMFRVRSVVGCVGCGGDKGDGLSSCLGAVMHCL